MKTNKMLPDSSISKVWENFRKMNGIVIELLANNWASQSNGTFTNTVSYEGFTSDEILEIDLYDDGTLTETQISEYNGYITEFNVEDGKIVAVATTKPTQPIKILARGEIVGKMVVNGGGSSDISASNVSCLDKDGQVSNVQKELDEQNKNMNGLRFGVDGDGNYGYYGADDSLIPFKKGVDLDNSSRKNASGAKTISNAVVGKKYLIVSSGCNAGVVGTNNGTISGLDVIWTSGSKGTKQAGGGYGGVVCTYYGIATSTTITVGYTGDASYNDLFIVEMD